MPMTAAVADGLPLLQPKALSHAAIRVRDVARSSDWYARVFGYRVFLDERHAEKNPRTFGLIGDLALEILGAPDASARRIDESGAGLAAISFSVEDVGAALSALRAAGIAKTERPVELGALKLVLFRDPDGILLEVIELPRGARSMAELGRRQLERGATAGTSAGT
jgi:catechol 2,3-dioxygenase-like lactoylglutathione lyase family enzyme